MTWNEYKKKILPSIRDYKENQLNVFSTGLASEIGELMKCDNEEYKGHKINTTNRQMEVGDVLWFIAALENLWGLPDTIYHNLVNVDIQVEPGLLNKWMINSDLFSNTGELIQSVHTGDLPEIQYNLNSLFAVVLDYCMFHSININDCLLASLTKLDLRKSTGKKSHTKEYKSVKAVIDQAGKDELLFEISCAGGKYNHMILTFKDNVTTFNNDDIILDFFNAINYTDKELVNTGFTMNYGPKFRKLLKESTNITNGFILGEDLIKPTEFKKFKTNTLLIQGCKPSLFRTEMTKLNQLLDYINDNKKDA